MPPPQPDMTRADYAQPYIKEIFSTRLEEYPADDWIATPRPFGRSQKGGARNDGCATAI